ncbi:MAG: glycosyltransferase family 2 protein [Clostridia bacterium]|nr:glycosyltransferase family 2 protein [Clostridia bacterium]
MIELTVLMPCLNEAEGIGLAITEAASFIERSGVSAEILIADNGSTDGSDKIARQLGARVIQVAEKGYGAALIAGISAAEGKYIIMGDSDGSYDFLNLEPFLQKLREGYTLVVGNRYEGGIQKGAMPFSHQYVGVPLLSFLGRLRYKTFISDFHCGLRGFDRARALELGLRSPGMEFATEIIGAFALAREPICQLPTTLRRDRRSGRPKLRTIRDGARHLRLIFLKELP